MRYEPLNVVSRDLGVSPDRMRRAFHSGRIPGELVAGRLILVDRAEASKAFAQDLRQAPVVPGTVRHG